MFINQDVLMLETESKGQKKPLQITLQIVLYIELLKSFKYTPGEKCKGGQMDNGYSILFLHLQKKSNLRSNTKNSNWPFLKH